MKKGYQLLKLCWPTYGGVQDTKDKHQFVRYLRHLGFDEGKCETTGVFSSKYKVSDVRM
jgi:hypothetical protein